MAPHKPLDQDQRYFLLGLTNDPEAAFVTCPNLQEMKYWTPVLQSRIQRSKSSADSLLGQLINR